MDIFVIKNNKVYDIDYSSLSENYDKYLSLIQKIIESFKIMDLNVLPYENPVVGFKINYTSDWQPVEEIQYNDRFVSLHSNVSDFQENLHISYSTYISKNITLDKAMNDYINSYKRYQQSNVTEPPHRITTANNYTALKTTIDFVQPNGSFRVMAILVQDGNYVYQLEYFATRAHFSLYLNEVQKMIDSFRIMVQSVYYQSPSHEEVNMTYLSNWNVIDRGDQIVFLLPNQSSTDKFREYLSIKILSNPSDEYSSSPFDEMVHKEINYYRKNLTNLDILESHALNLDGRTPSHKIILTGTDNDTQHKHKLMTIWTIQNDKVYFIKYEAEETNYSNHIDDIQTTIYSFIDNLRKKNESTINQSNILPGIKVGLTPLDLAVNPKTNKIYVANSGSNSVSVIDGFTDRVESNIIVGSNPDGVAVNPKTNKIYVTNSGSNSVSVIDGLRNKVIANVSIGESPSDLIVDPNEPWIYVANFGPNTVSVIDGRTDKVVESISELGISPIGLDLNPLTNTLYVSNQGSDTVSVIEYFTNETGGFEYNVSANIQVGYFDSITGIAVDKDTNVIYVSLYNSNLVRIINGSTNTIIDENYTSYNGPFDITINPRTNLLYVANSLNNTISIINGTITNIIGNVGYNIESAYIEVGQNPWDITINPRTNLLYVANSGSNTVSVINPTYNKVMAGVKFSIHPSNSGYLDCNGNKIYNVTYIRYNTNTSNIKCKAIPLKGFAFNSWNGSLTSNNHLSWINDFGYMINSLFGISSSNPVNRPETIINPSNSGTVSVTFTKGLNFLQKYGNSISTLALIISVSVPILLALPTSVLHKKRKLRPSKAISRLFSFASGSFKCRNPSN